MSARRSLLPWSVKWPKRWQTSCSSPPIGATNCAGPAKPLLLWPKKWAVASIGPPRKSPNSSPYSRSAGPRPVLPGTCARVGQTLSSAGICCSLPRTSLPQRRRQRRRDLELAFNLARSQIVPHVFQLVDVRTERLFDGGAVGGQNVPPQLERAERESRCIRQPRTRDGKPVSCVFRNRGRQRRRRQLRQMRRERDDAIVLFRAQHHRTRAYAPHPVQEIFRRRRFQIGRVTRREDICSAPE